MPKKEKKLLKHFWDWPPLNFDRRTDGRTDRRTTDNSALEKPRCLSAGGAKKYWKVLKITEKYNNRPVSLIAPFKINFLATENDIKVGSNIAKNHSLPNHMLTKSKSRSIASQITNLASRKSYLVIILPNSYQKLTKSKLRSSWSQFKYCSELLV